MRRTALLAVLLLGTAACPDQGGDPPDDSEPGLRFSISEGGSDNFFIRDSGISAHLNLQARPAPRLVVAFPAGNSGAALFFRQADEEQPWGAVSDLQTIEFADNQGRQLHGLRADISIETGTLILDDADVGSVRFLRKAVDYSALPPRPAPDIRLDGNRLRVSRERPDGLSAYVMEMEVLAGELRAGPGLASIAATDGALKIRVMAATGDPVERPPRGPLITTSAFRNEALENALAFLTYDDKMLAGSWRFLTYFGRDTLLTLRLLMPVLRAETAETGLASVLERLNDRGEVAHEEEIGELAVYRNLGEHGRASAEPVYDYKMVDDNLMLLPVLANYIETFGRDRAAAFLARRTPGSDTLGQRLVSNLRLVAQQAEAFAENPEPANLVAIKEGLRVGNWRDSQEGLAGGKYPYDVNAVLMPAALDAAAIITGSGLLDDYANDLPRSSDLARMAGIWETSAASYFAVSIPADVAREQLAVYARANGYPLETFPAEALSFDGIALNEAFEPVPVMHSDIAVNLLFLHSPESRLKQILANLLRPFPAGLATPVGVLAANPAFSSDAVQAIVTRNHYHGTVIWSWQQAMIIAGVDEQLRRDDLSAATRARLRDVRQNTWRGIAASSDFINSELWSFEMHDGQFVISPFGQAAGHLTESNAVQLWSTVFLAIPPGD